MQFIVLGRGMFMFCFLGDIFSFSCFLFAILLFLQAMWANSHLYLQTACASLGWVICCVTLPEMCFTQRGPCVGKAQLQHHVPAVVPFLMDVRVILFLGQRSWKPLQGSPLPLVFLWSPELFLLPALWYFHFYVSGVEGYSSSALHLLLLFSHYPRCSSCPGTSFLTNTELILYIVSFKGWTLKDLNYIKTVQVNSVCR